MEKSIILVKPDGLKKRVVGVVINRIEKEGLKLTAMKLVRLSDALLDLWYSHHKEKPFFPKLKTFMMSTPVVAMLWEGKDAIKTIRTICGPTDSSKAPKGTIRGDFGKDIQENIVHASDSAESADRESKLLFQPDDIHSYETS